jgi:hypothetical protein
MGWEPNKTYERRLQANSQKIKLSVDHNKKSRGASTWRVRFKFGFDEAGAV